MNKKLVGLALAVAMMFGIASMASAAVKFKFGAWMRYRGVLTDNQDRLDTIKGSGTNLARDDWKYYDQVFRPYFKASTDFARMYFQLDIPKFNLVGGEDGSNFGTGLVAFSDFGRTDVSVVTYKLQVKVPAVPGNWWVTMGYDNVFLPRGLVGRLPSLREFGIQIKGNLGIFKPQIEIWKRDESASGTLGLSFADDDDIYIGKLPFSPMKGVRILPYLVYHEQNRTAARSEKITSVYGGISASARHKVFTGKVDFVYQNGTIDRESSDATADSDVSAYVLWLQGGVTLGAANLSVNYVLSSGDSDQSDDSENQFFGIGCSPVTGDTGCDARTQGPTDMWFGDKYNDTVTVGSRNIGGNTGGTGGRYARGNGVEVLSFDASYKVLKNLIFQSTLGAIWSAHSRPDLTANGSTPFKRSRYIGTEIDVSATYTLYKGVSVTGGIDYLIAGDYGELATAGPLASQVPGGTNRAVNNNDNSWQAVWKLQWFF
jgi:hypothetical protein